MIFTHVSPGWRFADPGLSYYCPFRAKILTPKGSHMSAGGQRSASPGYELKRFSFPERDTYRRLPQIRYNQIFLISFPRFASPLPARDAGIAMIMIVGARR